jgi:hypothetical protein
VLILVLVWAAMVLIHLSPQLHLMVVVVVAPVTQLEVDAMAALVAARATTMVPLPVEARQPPVKDMLVAVMAAVARVAVAVVRVVLVLMPIGMASPDARAAMVAQARHLALPERPQTEVVVVVVARKYWVVKAQVALVVEAQAVRRHPSKQPRQQSTQVVAVVAAATLQRAAVVRVVPA